MANPVSWKVVEKGWPVYDRDGAEIGTVHEIAGDEEADIFDGFGVKTSTFGSVKYVPAEIVASIAVGEVRLTTSHDEVDGLENLHEEVEEQILPQKSRWYQRLAWYLYGRR